MNTYDVYEILNESRLTYGVTFRVQKMGEMILTKLKETFVKGIMDTWIRNKWITRTVGENIRHER